MNGQCCEGSPQTRDWVWYFIKFLLSVCKKQDPGNKSSPGDIIPDWSWDVSQGDRWAVREAEGAAEGLGL